MTGLFVCILAGGRGSRLAGLWDRPKCLVPVNGQPVIERLLQNVARAQPREVYLMLGPDWRDVTTAWLRERLPDGLRLIPMIEDHREGTAAAVRRAIGNTGAGPLMVLNGDTLPAFDLRALVDFHDQRLGAWATMAMRRCGDGALRDTYAGACMLSEEAQEEIYVDTRTVDFPAHLVGALPYYVPGFLDVGTPAGFELAKDWALAA